MYTTKQFKDILDLDIYEKVKLKKKEQPKYPTGIYTWLATYTKETPDGPSKRVSMVSITIISSP